MSPEEKLSIYLRKHIGSGTQSDFVKQAQKFGEQLDPAGFNRILKQQVKAKDDTYRKIAQIVLDRADATAADLWQTVHASQFSVNHADTELRLASGFTSYAALLLSALGVIGEDGVSKVPNGIRFAFSGKAGAPNWIENLSDPAELQAQTQKLDNVYVADDLVKLLEERQIDGVFMLRDTFNKAFEHVPNKPVQVCRIAVGYGTCCYLMGLSLTDVPSETAAMEEPMAFSAVRQLEYVYDQLARHHLEIFHLANPTINEHLRTFMSYRRTKDALVYDYSATALSLSAANRDSLLSNISAAIHDTTQPTMVALVGFEPILNRIYHEVVARPGNESLRYQYLNLSKLINEVSTYCLYCHPEVLNDPFKLSKINEFLNLINAQFTFDVLTGTITADILFPDTGANDILKRYRLQRVFDELHVRNNMLPLFRLVSQQLVNFQLSSG